MDTALRRIDELGTEIGPLRTQLVNFACRRVGARRGRPITVGRLCAAIIWAEIGDARRFTSSDQLVRFAGLDVTVYSSDGKRSPGHLSRQGSPQLRWAAFEAARCAARRGSPDYAYYHQLAAKRDGHNGKNPTLAVERKILRRCYHTLANSRYCPGAALPRGGGLLTMRCARALPIAMPAARSHKVPVATPLLSGLPGKNERPHPFTSPHVGHPIHHNAPDPRPSTQIRLGAGTRNALPHHVLSREGRR